MLENGPAGVRKVGWEKGSSGRQTIRRPEETRAKWCRGVGTGRISAYQREARSEGERTEASNHLVVNEERGHSSSQSLSLLYKMRVR